MPREVEVAGGVETLFLGFGQQGVEEVVGLLWQDTIYRRKLPGEGAFDVPGFIEAIDSTGFKGSWGVEILSDTLRKLPVREMAKRAFDATAAQFKA